MSWLGDELWSQENAVYVTKGYDSTSTIVKIAGCAGQDMGTQRDWARVTEYDRWKTTPPESPRFNRIVERVNELSEIELLRQCHARGINLDAIFDQLRDRLIEHLLNHDDTP